MAKLYIVSIVLALLGSSGMYETRLQEPGKTPLLNFQELSMLFQHQLS
jgi:hypothetical protein